MNLFRREKLILNILLRWGLGDRDELGIVFLDDVIFHCKTKRLEEDGLQFVLQGDRSVADAVHDLLQMFEANIYHRQLLDRIT